MENNSNSTDLKVANVVVEKLSETLGILENDAGSIVAYLEQWGNVERTFEMVEASLVERERKIEGLLNEVAVSNEERKLREREIDERRTVLEEREREIDEKGVVLERLEKEIDDERVVLEEQKKEIDEKGVVLAEREKKIKEKSVVLEKRETEIDARSVVLEKLEKKMGEKGAVLERLEKEIEDKRVVLEEQKKEIDKKGAVLAEREKKIREKSVVLEGREKEIDDRKVVLDSQEKGLKEKSGVLEEREREWVHLKKKEMTQVSENLQLMQKKLIEGQRLSNLRKRKIGDICKDIELTEAGIIEGWESLRVEVGVEFEEMETSEGCEGRIDQLFKNMDVNGVLSYVVENETELNVCEETLLDYLRLAPTPAKLVLKVIQSFHELGSDNSHGFKGKIGCINLLVGLMKLEEEISASVRKEAEVFAANLGSLVGRQYCSPLDVLCFVQFVVSFKLYDTDEILMFLQAFCIGHGVYWPDEHTKFRYKLSLSKKLLALVQTLISREKHLEAVIYICAFEMEDAFSLQPLLDAHFMDIRKTAQETVSEASTSAQDDAAKLELTALRNLLKCITYFKLEPNYSTNSIKLRITQLEKRSSRPNHGNLKIEIN